MSDIEAGVFPGFWAAERDKVDTRSKSIKPAGSRSSSRASIQATKSFAVRGRSLVKKEPRIIRTRSSSRATSTSDAGDLKLDPGSPGPWVVDHHVYNLVEEIEPLRPPKPSRPPTHGVQQWIPSLMRGSRNKAREKMPRRRSRSSERTFRVSFAEMQRMHLRKLQIRLVRHAVTMYDTKDESKYWETHLAAYVKAMKDYDYMMECSKRPRDGFLATGEREIDHHVTKSVIEEVIGDIPMHLRKFEKTTPIGPWEYDGKPIGGTRRMTITELSLKEFRDRLLLAAAGAFLLLGPMWLMVLHETLYTGLITTTVYVAVFGLVVVFRLEKLMDVLSSTAAYAAVLVVFVGLTTDTS